MNIKTNENKYIVGKQKKNKVRERERYKGKCKQFVKHNLVVSKNSITAFPIQYPT